MGRVLGTAGWLVFFAWLAQGCAVFQSATPGERAAQALSAVDAANKGADFACAAYDAAVVARRVTPDPEVTGRCNARILDK